MPVTEQDIYTFLIAWVRAALGDERFVMLVGYQKHARAPQGPYGSLYTTSTSTIGTGIRREVEYTVDDPPNDPIEKIDVHTSDTQISTVSLQFYDTNAHDNMRSIMNFGNTNTSREMLYTSGFSLLLPTSSRNLDDLLPDGFLERSQIDLTIQSSNEYIETVDVVTGVNVIINDDDEVKVPSEQTGAI